MDRFIPRGYVSTEQAIFTLSHAAAPDVWRDLPDDELKIWQETTLSFRGEMLIPNILSYLQSIMQNKPVIPCQLRVIHYRDMTIELLKRLRGGLVVAWSLDRGLKFGRVRAESWKLPQHPLAWSGTCIEVLETGRNRLSEKDLVVFVFREDVDQIENELQSWAREIAEKATLGRNRRDAARILTQAHAPGMPWPSLAKDWDLLKATPECRNITRDEVEKLRKQLNPNLLPRRGRPPKNPEKKIPKE